MNLQGIATGSSQPATMFTFDMTKSLDPFRFLLVAVSGWMNQQQSQLIDSRTQPPRFGQCTGLSIRWAWGR
jgi:hypothetical protein